MSRLTHVIGIAAVGNVRRVVLTLGLLAGVLIPDARVRTAQTQRPTFRSATSVVPLDVRVVDRQGRPVTDLTREDFIVSEDNVRQEITHFERQALTPGRPGPAPARSSTAPFSVDLQGRRVFYIELGRLWLGNPQFGLIEALTTFLRERLLPQDYAVVASFGRITDLTTDHEALAQVIERIAALHAFAATSKGRDAVGSLYGWRQQPADSPIRQALDQAFAPATSGLRLSLRPEAEFKKTLDAIYAHSLHGTPAGEAAAWNARQSANILMRDVLTLLGAVEYLRFIEGEKHLVYFPVGEIAPKAVEDDRDLARIANDARVALHVMARTEGLPPSGRLNLEADMHAKNIAAYTGGSVFINKWPNESLAQIDDITRHGYLLAYSPIKSAPDERYRKITVRVTRPNGATVMVREGYRSTAQPVAYDPETNAAKQHVLTVAEFPGGVDDLAVAATAKVTSPGTLATEVTIDLAQVSFTTSHDRHVAKLEVAIFCSDARNGLVGQRWITLDLNLTEATWAKGLAEGLKQSVTVPVSGRVRYVKAVVYDYGTSRAGAAVVDLK